MMISAVSTTPMQHWLNTPYGAYEGYPTYGNSFEDVLYTNLNDSDVVLGEVADKMLKDLGFEVMKSVDHLELLASDNNDTALLVIYLQDGVLGGYAVFNKG